MSSEDPTRARRAGTALGRAAVCLLLALTTVCCTGTGTDPAPAPPAPDRRSRTAPALRDPGPCPEVEGATCSTLRVPLDRTGPDGRSGRTSGTLDLRVVTDDGDAPRGVVLLLTGGPGQPGLPFFEKIRERLGDALEGHRLVMVDQRGTGAAALQCPRLQEQVGSSDVLVPAPAAVRDCAQRLDGRREFFTTADTVADLEDLRAALGVDTWTVGGVSYGTFTATRYARSHPRRTRGLVLDSVVPLDGAGALYEDAMGRSAWVLRTACEEQSCGFDPAKDLAEVVRRDGNGVDLFHLLVTTSVIDPKLTDPRLDVLDSLHASAEGDPGQLDTLLEDFGRGDDTPPRLFSSGLHAATLCADTPWPWDGDDSPSEREEALRAAVARITPEETWPFTPATTGAQGIPRTCLHWPPPRRDPPELNAPGRMLTMPVLLLAGDRDLSTPLAWAQEAARQLPSSRLVVVEGGGHSVLYRTTAGVRAVREFLRSQP